MTPEQLAWFQYHPETPTTGPKLEAVRAGERKCSTEVMQAVKAREKLKEVYRRINEATLEFALAIDEHCPECADKQAALHSVRLAKMAANEAVSMADKSEQLMFLVLSAQELTKARWLASSAIVLHTEEEQC